jgi:putative tryptophan/tyrosine transport system substrate-binding protein
MILGGGMRRREFLGVLGGAAALSFPRPGYGQIRNDLPVVGFLLPPKLETTVAKERISDLRKGLQEGGYIEGTNYSLAVRSTQGDINRVAQIASELGALTPRLFVVVGSGVDVIRRSFPEVPLVFTAIAADPVALGWVQSYVHPGGRLTGNVMNAVGGEETMTQKRIGLFKQLAPDLTRLGMIASDVALATLKEKDALRKVATEFGFELVHYGLKTIDDLEGAFAAGLRDDVSAFYISGEPLLSGNLSRVMTYVTASRKPSVGTYPDWGRAGLLMSYATDPADGVRKAGIYAAKILKGAKPDELPIEQASKFILVINQKTAKALGISVPPTLLALADEVIE